MNNLNPKRSEALEAKIRFRCPNCSKLYISDPNAIFVEKPEYKCTSCQTNFYISLSEALNTSEVVGYEVLNRQEEVTESEISKLEKTPEPSVTFDKVDWSIVEGGVDFKETKKTDVIEDSWSVVLKDFSNKDVHNAFINIAKDQGQVGFAKAKYGEILRANPHDEIAKSCFSLIEINGETEVLLAKETNKKQLSMNFWATLIVTAGFLLMILGLFIVPEYQKLAGLGLGLVVFTFALKSLFQKSPVPY